MWEGILKRKSVTGSTSRPLCRDRWGKPPSQAGSKKLGYKSRYPSFPGPSSNPGAQHHLHAWVCPFEVDHLISSHNAHDGDVLTLTDHSLHCIH